MFGENVVDYYISAKPCGIAVVHSFVDSPEGGFHAWYLNIGDIFLPSMDRMNRGERFANFEDFSKCIGVHHALVLGERFFDSPVKICPKKKLPLWKRLLNAVTQR